MNSTFCALKKVHPSKQTFFGQMSIEKQPAIGSENFTVGLFAMAGQIWSLHLRLCISLQFWIFDQ